MNGFKRGWVIPLFFSLWGLTVAAPAAAAYTVTPETWNIIGLDSNTPASGPNHFPVGAKVCGGTPGVSDTATLTWDAGGTDNGTYIYLRAGSANPVTYTFGAGGCADAYFEVEVNQTALAFDQTRRYHITAGGISTPTPRELYVERLVSQGRNGVTDLKLNGVSVAAGGSMNMVVGNTYTIELDAFTATQGYSQLESFINFSNVVFQILSVNTTYSVVSGGNSGGVISPNSYLYSNACLWDNDPTSPTYRSCLGSGNAGGTITTTYTIKILGGGGSTVALNTLAHDFSGSSFHYNSDYSVSARYGNIIDPTAVTIAKNFSPGTTNAGGVSTLTFTLTNPNAGAISGLNFIDVFPTSPGAMTLSSTTTANTCGGTLTDSIGGPLAVGSTGIKLNSGIIPASSSCNVQVVVTAPTLGTYNNTSNHLFVDTLDTGKFATASLTVNSAPLPPSPSATCSAPVQLAAWNFDNLAAAANSAPAYSAKAADVATATAALTGGTGWSSAILAANAQSAANSWASQGYTTAGTTTSATATYIDFVLDTSNYGGVRISYSADTTNGNWGGTNHLYSYSKADAGAFTLLIDTVGMPTAFTTYTATAAATGTTSTTFRINASGSKSNPAYSFLYLDDIIFSGCTRPNPNLLTITKSFATNPVAVNGTSNLTFTITNSNATSTASLTGISFTDTLPLLTLQGTVAVTNGSPTITGTGTAFRTQLAANSIISISGVSYTVLSITSDTLLTLTANYAAATTSGLSISAGLTIATSTASACGGTNNVTTTASTGTIAVTGGTLAPGASCTVTVNNVKANAAGSRQNVSGFISSTETGSNTSTTGTAKATLTAILPPSISKLFAPNPILANGISTLTFTITNPNQNDALNGVVFTDTFPVAPGAMTVAAPLTTTNTCGGSLLDNLGGALAAGDPGISLSAGTIAAGSSCTVTVKVTAATLGTYTNTSGAVSATTAGAGNTATGTLTIDTPHPAISAFKEIASTNLPATLWNYYLTVPTGGNVYYRLQVQNDGDVPLSSVTVVDNPQVGDDPVSLAGCSWTDGDGNPLIAPFTLGVADNANNDDFAVCTIGPFTAVSGSHTNTLLAEGTYSAVQYTDTDWAEYATTNLTVVKSATQSYFTAAGNTLNYSYLVTNSGAAILIGPVTITDDKATVTCPALSTIGDADNWFDPGEALTCTATYTVVAADVTAKLVTNTAYATVSGVNSANASLTIPLAPDLSATKTNNVGGVVSVGGVFNWTITVSNSTTAGSATFTSGQILLTDDLPTSGATYVAGAVVRSGATGTGTISCSIATNTLTCAASGGTIVIPGALQGTISVTSGSAAVTGAGTSFTTQLTAGSVLLISGVTYTVSSITDNTSLTLSANYTGATASGILIPGSFSVPVAVTTTAIGSLVNPRGGGICRVDPGTVVAEISDANNDCANTVTVQAMPNITLQKNVSIFSDPSNLLVNPKYIPGAIAEYTIVASNSGGPADNNSTVITDLIPPNTALYVNDIGGANSGPVLFTQGGTSSTLTYTFTALNDGADDISFSTNSGTTWIAVPTAGANGCDPAINAIRINPKGTFIGNTPNPSFQLKFRVCVQ